MVPSPGLQELNDDIVRQHPDVSWAGAPTKDPDTADLPSGTVTFLFTDLEGSTRLWEEHPEAMREALARHDEILRDAVEMHQRSRRQDDGRRVPRGVRTAHDAVDGCGRRAACVCGRSRGRCDGAVAGADGYAHR